MNRVYLRNGVPGWTLDQQVAALRKEGVYRGDGIFCDELSEAAIRRRDPKELVQRADMLKRTGRRGGEEIYVTSFYCFALNAVDLMQTLALAASRNAKVIALHPHVEVPPNPHAAVLAEAAQAFDKGRRDRQTLEGRSIGQRVAAEKRVKRTEERIKPFKHLWELPTEEIRTQAIAEQAGVSPQTLYNYWGLRSTAQLRATRRKSK